MQINEINISKDQWLGDVIDHIETNTILNKTITGIGATTLEINTPRHSIIIEPNVPVIVGKESKHSFIRGVYEGITTKMIEKYLYEKDGYYKIMTTPESFGKVKRAISNVRMNLYVDFFLLFDECEKIIQDVDYRKKITLPMNVFFNSQNKAMVSATPITPSDPRFTEQGFRMDKIVPDYKHTRNLILYPTNNVHATLRLALQHIKADAKICLFFNSTNGIEELIKLLGIKKESNIYCGTESKDKLKSHGFSNAYDRLTTTDDKVVLNKYNFFTSRFYSAVDIELTEKPVVIMLTELFSAPHSMIDPSTEAIQIAGRFRNGISNLVHIFNYNRKIEYKDADSLSAYLDGQHTIYSQLQSMRKYATCIGEIHILQQALDCVDYSRFVTPNGDKDYFMYDNAFQDERIKCLYVKPDRVKTSYRDSEAFEIQYRYISSALSDSDRKALESKNTNKADLNKLAFNFIKKFIKHKNEYDKEYMETIGKSYGLVLEAYETLGENKVLETGFKDNDLRQAIAEKKAHNKTYNKGVIVAVHNAFSENTWYSTTEINTKLTKIYAEFDITPDRRGLAPKIKLYFYAKQHNKGNARGWMLYNKIG